MTGVVGRADVQACLFSFNSLLAHIKSPVEVSALISCFSFPLSLVFFPFGFSSEAVTGVVGRADVQACLFFILSLLAYMKSPVEVSSNISFVGLRNTKWRWMLLCLVLCIASMLSKEQGITVLGTCAVYEIMVIINSNRKQNPWEILTRVSMTYACQTLII